MTRCPAEVSSAASPARWCSRGLRRRRCAHNPRHRPVVDPYDANAGFPLAFAYSFLAPHGPPSAGSSAATAVVVLRHGALPIALGNDIWQKYKIGEAFKILDTETKAPAVKNPFLHPKAGVLLVDDMAVDRL